MDDRRRELPTNQELARLMQEIADYLAVKGEGIYRIIAYEKAAAVFSDHPTSVAGLALEGRLRELPGVGGTIERKVIELIETGRIAALEELRAVYPEGVLELMRLPGVGPKTARRLFEELGVADLDAVREAAAQGRLRALPGMGVKTEQNLLKAIAAVEARPRRHLLGVVEPLAERLVSAVRSMPGVSAAEYAGSLRRRRSTVRDIDLVAASTEPASTMAAFAALPELARVDEIGTTKLAARTHTGVGVDLRVVAPASFGNLLQHFTGSADHNVALRAYAQRMGLKVSEYDVEEVAGGRRLTCVTEAEVYAALGLPWIPPELREDRGELEAARAGALPRLLELADLKGDLHVHSTWSDGRATIEEMARAARGRGLEYICFCDHSQSLGMGKGLTPDQVKAELQAVREADDRIDGITLLCGSEVDILADGRIDLPDGLLSELDVVTASIHSGFGQPVERIMARLEAAMDDPHIDVIGHPTGRLLGRRDPYEVDVERLVDRAAATGTALEINAAYDRLDLSAAHARLARDRGVALVISSDAHSPGGFDLLRFGVGEARRGWIEARDVLNTLPLPDLRVKLKHLV